MTDLETLSKLYLELAHVVDLSTKTYRELDTERRVKSALRHLDHATPQQRNGPVYQAADVLRGILYLPPMVVGGKPSDGLA